MNTLRALRFVLALSVSLAPLTSSAREDDHERRDAVRRAMEAGQVLPLAEILSRVRSQVAGDVSDIAIEGEHGSWRYELRVIDRAGRVLEVRVDAQNGKIERIEEK